MHRPVDYGERATSMRWKISIHHVLRLARNCPKLASMCWYANGLTPLTDANGPNVDDLEELLESRGKQTDKLTYYEIEVFAEYGPWKRNSHHYRTALSSQHPPGPQ